MKATALLATLVLGILVASFAVEAQPAGKVPRIGWLTTDVRPTPTGPHPLLEAFRQGLRDLGYVEGQNMRIEARYAEGQEDQCPALASELIHLPVDVLVAAGTAPIQAAQHATSTIPIVMAWGTDPVDQGFVASLARPGGNITGLSAMRHDLLGKQLELLTQMVPTASRIGVLINPANPGHVLEVREVQRVAQILGVQLHMLEARSPDDLQGVLATLPREEVQVLLVNASRLDMTTLALQSPLPAMYHARRDVEAGGLMAYGPNQPALHYRAAYYVDRLLKGATPADLPVEQPTKFELVINLKTAKALGLTIPPSLLFQADEVIQ